MNYKLCIIGCAWLLASCAPKGPVAVVPVADSVPQVALGAARLAEALRAQGYTVLASAPHSADTQTVIIGCASSSHLRMQAAQAGIALDELRRLVPESYVIKSGRGTLLVAGADASGALYGCLALCERLGRKGALPRRIAVADSPAVARRGVRVGLLRASGVADSAGAACRSTPEIFPWFYNKKLWVEYLDVLLANRFNALYLMEGQPYALLAGADSSASGSVADTAGQAANAAMLRFVAYEAARRGIALVPAPCPADSGGGAVPCGLEPYRFGSPEIICRAVADMRAAGGSATLCVGPQTSLRGWPYTADKVLHGLLEYRRSWMWYKAWGRYAWDCEREPDAEERLWAQQLADVYGCGRHGRKLLEAYNESGALAVLLAQYLCGPSGPDAQAQAVGREAMRHSRLALRAVESAEPHVEQNAAELARFKNDILCLRELAGYVEQQEKARLYVQTYRRSRRATDLANAVPSLEESLACWRRMVQLTDGAYRDVPSLQACPGKTWGDLQPRYRSVLDSLKQDIERVR